MSKIVVIGGTGYTGALVVAEAHARGHEVVAVSRSGPADPLTGVRYAQAAAADAASLVTDADVVVGALSPRGDTAGTLVEVYAALAAAATAAGARFVVIGGFGSLRPAPGAPRFAEGPDLPPEFAAEATEMNAVRAWLEDSAAAELDWLFVSPAAGYGAYLPQGAPRGTYRTSGDVALFDADGQSAIEGPDFARAVLDTIEAGQPSRTQVSFAY